MLERFTKIAISLCIVLLLSVAGVLAQSRGGRVIDVKIYFPYDEVYIDSLYMNNHKILNFVDSLLKDSSYIATLDKIEVSAQSSPEGSISYNTKLSERRKVSLKEYFTTSYPEVNASLWSFKAVAEDWESFHQHLVDDPNLPNRDDVISISSSDRGADSKEWLLKTMNGGQTWLYIKEHILPFHRWGASILFIPAQKPISPSINFTESAMPFMASPKYTPVVSDEYRALFAIKTNLVLDALSVVNLGVEIPIGNKFSIVGEVVYPWWRSWSHNWTMQIESYHAEVKYWLGERRQANQLEGWSVGLYGGWGLYDIQPFSESGVQGDFYDAGVQLSYSHSIAKNLYLEYTIGAGYVSTDYNDYYMAYDTDKFGDIKVIPYPWMNNKLRSVLPTRAGVSLVWHLNSKMKGGKR